MAAAVLHRLGRGAEIARRFAAFPAAPAVAEMLARGVRCPPTTGCGRWFDAACGLLGVRPLAGFEGEAPMVLESLVTVPTVLAGGWQVQDATLDLLPLMAALLDLDPVSGANLFHGTLAAALADWVRPALAEHGGDRLVLSGGCLVNAVLAEALIAELAHSGITALTARAVPPNDGGLSLGQAWAGALTLIGDKPCCSSA
jgi:hydrogenase maturation protein HypF